MHRRPHLTATLGGALLLTLAVGCSDRVGATLYGAHGQVLSRGIGVHQTALYDMISTALLFALLWFLNKRQVREGVLACVFGLWYGTGRFITDFLRIDKEFFGLTGSQWTAITVAVICAALLLKWGFGGHLRSPTSAQRNADSADASESSEDMPASVGSEKEPSVDQGSDTSVSPTTDRTSEPFEPEE